MNWEEFEEARSIAYDKSVEREFVAPDEWAILRIAIAIYDAADYIVDELERRQQ